MMQNSKNVQTVRRMSRKMPGYVNIVVIVGNNQLGFRKAKSRSFYNFTNFTITNR